MRKAIFFFLILALIFIFFYAHDIQAAVTHFINSVRITGGLVGYWSFDGSTINWSTNVASDLSGNGKSGQLAGMSTSTSPVPGIVGQALKFNGVNGFISAGNVNSGVQSVAFWIRATSSTRILDLNGTASVEVIGNTITANSFTSPTIYIDGAVTSTLPDSQWHHIAITTGTGINASAVDLGRIGSAYFGGVLDEVRVYNRALSSGEVQYLYQLNAKERGNKTIVPNNTGLVGYWTFDDCDSCSRTLDMSGTRNSGALQGSASRVAGIFNNAVNFSAAGDYISIPNNSTLDITSNITVSLWMKPKNSTGNDGVFTKNTLSSDQGVYTLIYGDGGAAAGQVIWRLNGGNDVQSTSNSVPPNRWTHVVATYNKVNQIIYINGVQNASVAYTAAINTNTGNLIIGTYFSTSFPFFGAVDQVRLYNRALSAAEIQNLFKETRRFYVNGSQNDKFTNGLVGMWSFNGSTINWSTGVVSDTSGSAKNGQQINMSTSTSPVPGIVGQALKFNGVSSYITAGNVNSGVQSVAFWMRSTSTSRILDLNGTASVEVIGNTITANSFTSPTIYIDGAVTSTLPDSQWHHIAITTGTGINASAVDLGRIGSAYFGGTLDEVRVYNRAITSAEVFELYRSGRR